MPKAVISRALETRPKNAIHWSTRTMAEAGGLNQNAIVRIWRAFGLKPRLLENFKLSTDPPRSRVIRCLRPDGGIFYLRHAPDPKAKPNVLLHVPVFWLSPLLIAH